MKTRWQMWLFLQYPLGLTNTRGQKFEGGTKNVQPVVYTKRATVASFGLSGFIL